MFLHNKLLIFIASSFSCYGAISSSDPCLSSQHLIINDPRRSVTTRLTGGRAGAIDDSTLAVNWYRFRGPGGSYIPNTCPGFAKCGTVNPIWMRGVNPPDDGQIHRRQVCANDGLSCSRNCFSLNVKNCGLFLAYQLRPPQSSATAYCITTPGPGLLSGSPQKPVLELEETSGSFLFRCKLTNPNTANSHTIHWTADGNVFAEQQLKSGQTSSVVREDELNYHGCSILDMHITCSASVRDPKTNKQSPHTSSKRPGYFFGLQMVDEKGNEVTELTVNREQSHSTKLYVKNKIPVKCNTQKWKLDSSLGFVSKCFSEFRVENPSLMHIIDQLAHSSCSSHRSDAIAAAKKLKFGVCGVTMEEGTRKNYKDHPITVMPLNDGIPENEPETRYVRLYADATYQAIWKDYSKYIKINVVSTKAPTECTVSTASGLKTFDNSNYFNNKKGEFVLYESTKHNIRVHVYAKPCPTSSRTTCYCGVAAQAGNDVILIDGCRSMGDIIYGNNPSGAADVQTKSVNRGEWTEGFTLEDEGTNYKIKFPHGAVLRVSPVKAAGFTSFTLSLTPSLQDYSDAGSPPQVQGLCGVFSRDNRDDLRLRSGAQYTVLPVDRTSGGIVPSGFLTDWSVPRKESMYNGQISNTAEYVGQQRCACVVNGNSSQEHVMCTFGNPCSTDKALINKVSSMAVGRRRRAVETNGISPQANEANNA